MFYLMENIIVFVFEQLIPSFANLVFLFTMVSDFGMCCGHYQKILDQRISAEEFLKETIYENMALFYVALST